MEKVEIVVQGKWKRVGTWFDIKAFITMQKSQSHAEEIISAWKEYSNTVYGERRQLESIRLITRRSIVTETVLQNFGVEQGKGE